jgi:hypothetical protein
MDQTIQSRTTRRSGAKKYTGGCRCGKVRYETEIDLTSGPEKCNCTICTETNFWGAIVKPSAFRLLSGAESLTDCRFNSKAPYFFCRHCDIRSFCRGDIEELGGEVYAINLNCLDAREEAIPEGAPPDWKIPIDTSAGTRQPRDAAARSGFESSSVDLRRFR